MTNDQAPMTSAWEKFFHCPLSTAHWTLPTVHCPLNTAHHLQQTRPLLSIHRNATMCSDTPSFWANFMHFIMTALGSYGDVHPIAGLGSALHRRGHQVMIIANPNFQPVIESVGAKLLPLGTQKEYEELADHEDLWHPIRGPLLVMRTGVVQYLRELYALIESHYRPGETVLVAHPLDMASRIFQEKHAAPLASLVLAPLMLRSYHQTPTFSKMLTSSWVPRWLRRFQFWVADRCVIDPLLGPPINELRQELDLQPPASGIFRDWNLSPQLVLGLFPEWFARAQPDWPKQVALTGFPLWERSSCVAVRHRSCLRPARRWRTVSRFFEPPLKLVNDSNGEVFYWRSTLNSCLRSYPTRCVILVSYRLANSCLALQSWFTTAVLARALKVWLPVCRSFWCRWLTINLTMPLG